MRNSPERMRKDKEKKESKRAQFIADYRFTKQEKEDQYYAF
jgi:hypothetical protein